MTLVIIAIYGSYSMCQIFFMGVHLWMSLCCITSSNCNCNFSCQFVNVRAFAYGYFVSLKYTGGRTWVWKVLR
jgi:hypothetical protein